MQGLKVLYIKLLGVVDQCVNYEIMQCGFWKNLWGISASGRLDILIELPTSENYFKNKTAF